MPPILQSSLGEYVLATGTAAVRRLHALHEVYAPAGRRVLQQAGIKEGMHIADFGCGVGAATRMLAEMVGPSGSVTGIDVNPAQLIQAQHLCATSRLTNTQFVQANACDTGLPSDCFDLVYCRFLLLHLPDPSVGLHEMKRVLKPGGIIVAEDADLTTASSVPSTALDELATLWGELGSAKGLDYTLGARLYHLVRDAGFAEPDLEVHQPAILKGENRLLPLWSAEEAASAFVDAGVITRTRFAKLLHDVQLAIDDDNVVILAPRMSIVWGRKH